MDRHSSNEGSKYSISHFQSIHSSKPPSSSSSSSHHHHEGGSSSKKSPAYPTLAPFQPPPRSSKGSPSSGSQNCFQQQQQLPIDHQQVTKSENTNSTWNCKLCFYIAHTENAFYKHLTLEHFKDRIKKRVGYPFRCSSCDYKSPSHYSNGEKTEDLVLHYGVKERVSIRYYEQELRSRMSDDLELDCSSSAARPGENFRSYTSSSPPTSITCRLCNADNDNQLLLLRHLTLKHFAKALYEELPKESPFRCPQKECNETKSDSHKLLLHYGMDHKKAMYFYKRHPDYTSYDRSSGPSCSKDSVPKVELPDVMPSKLHKLKAVVMPYNPLSEKQKSDKSSNSSRPSSRSTESPSSSSSSPSLSASSPSPMSPDTAPPSSGGGGGAGRSSSESASTRIRMEYLEKRIKSLESQQKEALRNKEAEFERKLAAKESALNEEKVKARLLEEKLAERESLNSNLKDETKRLQDKLAKLDQDIAVKNQMYSDLMAAKAENDQMLEEKETERINSYEELYQKEKELDKAVENLEKVKQQLTLEEKSKSSAQEEITELKKNIKTMEDTVKKVQTESDDKQESIAALEKENDELKSNIDALSSKKEKDDISMLDTKKKLEDEIADLRDKLKTKPKETTDKTALKAAEKDRKELQKKVKVLESTLGEWEKRQFTNVKLISGLEKERDSLQLKLKEMKDGNLSHEDELYWKDVAIRNANKETKAVQMKHDELFEKVENLTVELSNAEDLVENYKKKCTDMEKVKSNNVSKEKYDSLAEDLEVKESEIEHLKISLASKRQSFADLNAANKKQKAELDKLKKAELTSEDNLKKALARVEELETDNTKLQDQMKEHESTIEMLKARQAAMAEASSAPAPGGKRKKGGSGKVGGEQRVEMLMMNQVLKDMDTVIKLRDKGISPDHQFSTSIIHEESFEGASVTDSMASPLTVDTEDIVHSDHSFHLSSPPVTQEVSFKKKRTGGGAGNSGSNKRKGKEDERPEAKRRLRPHTSEITFDIEDDDDDDDDEVEDNFSDIDDNLIIEDTAVSKQRSRLSSFSKTVHKRSSAKLQSNNNKRRKTKKRSTSAAAAAARGGATAANKSSLMDVTAEYETEEGGDYVCGVCGAWDAPQASSSHGGIETTDWIGCDCDRWFHKQCTGLKKFTTKFSCKSLKMDCLVIPITMDSVTWEISVPN